MSNYWKKKLDELNGVKTNKTSSETSKKHSIPDYWANKTKELEEANKKKTEIAPVKDVTVNVGETAPTTLRKDLSFNGAIKAITTGAILGGYSPTAPQKPIEAAKGVFDNATNAAIAISDKDISPTVAQGIVTEETHRLNQALAELSQSVYDEMGKNAEYYKNGNGDAYKDYKKLYEAKKQEAITEYKRRVQLRLEGRNPDEEEKAVTDKTITEAVAKSIITGANSAFSGDQQKRFESDMLYTQNPHLKEAETNYYNEFVPMTKEAPDYKALQKVGLISDEAELPKDPALVEKEKKEAEKKEVEKKQEGQEKPSYFNFKSYEGDLSLSPMLNKGSTRFGAKDELPWKQEDKRAIAEKYGIKLAEEESPALYLEESEFEKDLERFARGLIGFGAGVIATPIDIADNAIGGVLKMAENVVDAGAYAVGGIGKATGLMSEETSERIKETIAADLVGEAGFGSMADNYSFLGEKTDSLTQSAAQLVAKAALQYVGVPWQVTTGVQSFGSGTEEAFAEGAGYGEAGIYGGVNAVAEIGSEALFKGSGLGEKGLINTGKLTNALTDKLKSGTAKSLAKYSVDLALEGGEEVITSVATNAAKALYKEESVWELITNDEALQGYLDDFVSGFVISGGMNAGKVTNSIKTETDYNTGLTANEQKVIDKEIENRIAEAGADGKTLTNKDKKAIEEQVYNDLKKGYISTDTIESVLGGEAYNSYQDSVNKDNSIAEQEKAIEDEIAELVKTPESQFTIGQRERLTELREMRENLDKTSNTADLKTKLDEAIANILKGERKGKGSMLFESYNELTRRGKAFEADVSKYAPEQQAVIQKAIDSGILNNTNRTHDFVDMVAKISADKGVSFDFANNEKLKQSGFALNGKTVNGYVTKDGITLNIDSHKALNSVVGHEITHVLEGTELYTELQNALFEYAKTKGEYDSRLANLTELYKGVKGADVNAELTADLAGDYLFTDGDFVTHLSTTKRNVFQKIYDEIKYLYKTATAGSKEARELEKVKRAFDKAYKEGGTAQSEAKYSLNIKHTDGSVEVLADARNLTNEQAIGYLKQAARGELRRDTYIPVRKDTPQVIIDTLEQVNENVSNSSLVMQVRKAKQSMKAENPGGQTVAHGNNVRSHGLSPEEVIDIIDKLDDPSAAVYQTNRKDKDGKPLPNNAAFFVEYNKNGAEGLAVIEFDSSIDSDSVGTDFGDTNYHTVITVFEPDTQRNGIDFDYVEELLSNPDNFELEIKRRQSTGSATGEKHPDTSSKSPSFKDIIPQNSKKSIENAKFSLSEDSNGNQLSPAVQKRFGNSKVVDENGALKVVYHGTATGEFSIFDKTKGSVEGDFGSGFYFTDNESDVSEHYEGGGPDFDNKVGRRADEIWNDEPDIEYEEAERRAREELFKGSHKFEVYLNIENPAIVGETTLFDSEKYYEEYDRNDYDSDEDYEGDVEQLIIDDIDGILWDIQQNLDVDNTDGIANVLYDAIYNGGIDIESLKKKINDLYLDNDKVELIGNEVTRQIIESLGYDGIVDPTVSSKWNMDIEDGTTHYIAFKPNQIKAITNQDPTDNPDIHRSLSAEGEAPKRYGNYNVYGEDIKLNAPTQDNAISPLPTTGTKANTMENSVAELGDIAPITEAEANAMASENLDSLTDADVPHATAEYYGAKPITEAPIAEEFEAIRPPRESKQSAEPRMKRVDSTNNAPDGMEERSWVGTSTGSEAVDGIITPDDIPDDVRYYQVKSNKKSLETANTRLARDGYAKSREYFEGRMHDRKLTVEDIALGERLIQEAAKAGDAKAVRDLIIDISIIGTELGQRVQALSMINRLTPEGQLKALIRTVERGKAKGDKAFEGVEVTEDMTKRITDTIKEDGTFDQAELDAAVEDVKQQIADQMSVSFWDKVNAWRYLSMLGNPKTHIRNIVSNVAMMGTRAVKNAVARTIEGIFLHNRKPTLNTTPPANKTTKPAAQNAMPNGTRVRANDRGNIGTIRSYNAQTGKYTVYFENEAGQNATVQLDASLLSPLHPLKTANNGKSTDNGDIGPVRTKTWRPATKAVKAFAKATTAEMESTIKGDNKYSDEGSIKAKRKIFKSKVAQPINAASNANSNLLGREDWAFSKHAYRTALQEYLTANGIKTEEDIKNNPELVAKAKDYALEEARKATFQQDSYMANKIREIESKNPALGVAIGSTMPFKKTPINIAKTGVAYSPLGLARGVYDAVQARRGKKDASEAIDHLAQGITGTALMLIGYALADAGILNGAGDDDKEGKYDYQLGKQSYSFNFGGDTYSLNWLSPVAMPLFVGANFYETLVEKNEWDANVVIDTLGQTLDPMSEMSFLSSLDDVLSSYDSGMAKIWGAGESMVQNYATQFIPTLSSQIAAVADDTKRSTKPSRDSGFTFGEETLNKIKYKIPGLRNTLEPTTDIWGNEMKQTENVLARGFESFISPANKRAGIGTAVDDELKALYGEVGKAEILPAIPYNYIDYDGAKYDMSAKDYTDYKKTYGQTAYDLMESLFDTNTYQNATSEERAHMVADVYDYARDAAKKEYFTKYGVDFTNSTVTDEDTGIKSDVFKENPIKGAIAADLPVDEYVFKTEYPAKYSFFKANGITYGDYKNADEDGKRAYSWAYDNPEKYTVSKAVTSDLFAYRKLTGDLYDIKADKDANGKSISGSRKDKVTEYLNDLDIDYGAKLILFKSEYNADDTYNNEIVEYLNGREDISYEDTVTILKELGFKVDSKGNVTWD